MTARILLVSDVRLYLDGIVLLLREETVVEVVGTASTVQDALGAWETLNPDVTVVDLAMRDGLSAIRRLAAEKDQAKVVALTASELDCEVIACAEAGAIGYVTRDSSVKDFVRHLQAAKMGQLHCSPEIAGSLIRRVKSLADRTSTKPWQSPLTKRERCILDLLHKPNKDIARELDIELATVKNHVHRIFEKLGVHSRAEAVVHFGRFGNSALVTGATHHAPPPEPERAVVDGEH